MTVRRAVFFGVLPLFRGPRLSTFVRLVRLGTHGTA